MQISYNWLKDYCKHELPAHVLAEKLSHAGMCVETYEPRDGDWMLDVEVTSNRPDCLSHLGLAREVAAMTGTETTSPPIQSEITQAEDFREYADVLVESTDLCPHYTARVIKNVTVGPSPEWMQQRLITCGLRPVNNIVDITNYVLLESGQPMHAFDLAKIHQRKLIVRNAREGEKITTIDGTECSLSDNMCVIADARGAIAVAGIMGGINSEINGNTTDVLLESARFSPPDVRRTARKLGLSSDSSYRFERGVDPENVERASRRAAELMSELAGGIIVPGLADLQYDNITATEVSLRLDRLSKVLGIAVSNEKVKSIFTGLGLNIIDETDSAIKVSAPPRRPDLTREIDLIEEVVRIYGYDKIPETTHIPVSIAPQSKKELCERKIKRLLAGYGFCELVTSSLITPQAPAQTTQPWFNGRPIALRNPVSTDKTHLRLTNMGNFLSAKNYNNSHKVSRVNLFEIGKIYLPNDDTYQEQPTEKRCLTMLSDRDNGFFELKGILENILAALYITSDRPAEKPEQLGVFETGKSLNFYLDNVILGCVGICSSKLAASLDLANAPALMELDFDLLLEYASIEPHLRPLPKFPNVRRDIAVVVDESLHWSDIESCVHANAPEELEELVFVDIYRGKQIPDNKKSVTISMSFRAADRTLRSEEGDKFRDKVLGSLKEAYGAYMRS